MREVTGTLSGVLIILALSETLGTGAIGRRAKRALQAEQDAHRYRTDASVRQKSQRSSNRRALLVLGALVGACYLVLEYVLLD